MSNSLNTTDVNLDGLLEILGRNLYSTPAVALRELVQNAHDACNRRLIEDTQTFAAEIRIKIDTKKQLLIIEDNGSGLTAEEVKTYLSTIGSGYTRTLRNDTSISNDELIGYFGLGFLSAFVVSTKVEVTTCSYQSPDTAWKYTSKGGKTFSLQEAPSRPIGSHVALYLKPEFSELADESRLRALLKLYCCLLPIPVFIQNDTQAVNAIELPWKLPTTAPQVKVKNVEHSFVSNFERGFDAIHCIQIPKDNDIGASGMLWIQDGGTYGSSDNRNISVFIRGMFISGDENDLLPRWAGFMGGVVQCNLLKPTASRESLQQDDDYFKLQEYLLSLIIKSLKTIVIQSPSTWKKITSIHNQALLAAAICDDELFDATNKRLTVPTIDGDMSLPAIARQSGGKLYIKNESDIGFEEVVLKAQGIPIIQGYYYAVLAYCTRFCAQEVSILKVLGEANDLNDLVSENTPLDDLVLATFNSIFPTENYELITAAFNPESVPLLIVPNNEAIRKNRLESNTAEKSISSAALSLARLHTQTITKQAEERVYINNLNPVIKKLSSLNNNKRIQTINLLKSMMLLIAGSKDKLHSIDHAFNVINDSLTELLGK